MPRIKMFKANRYIDYDGDEYNTVISGETEWTDVTPKEYESLSQWVQRKNQKKDNDYIFIVSELDVGVTKLAAVADYKKMMEKEKRAAEKRAATAAKRKATIAKKKEEARFAEYEKLRAEFGDS